MTPRWVLAGALGGLAFLAVSVVGIAHAADAQSALAPWVGPSSTAQDLQSASSNVTTGGFFAMLNTGAAAAENTDFRGYWQVSNAGAKVRRITCSYGTAGTGGTTGVVVTLRDRSGSADVCSCTMGACTAGSGGCDCNGAMALNKQYTIRLSASTDCAGNPVDIYCNAEIAR